jgi:hypothetical protein
LFMCPEGVILPEPMKITKAAKASVVRAIRFIFFDSINI